MSAAVLLPVGTDFVIPQNPPVDLAVAPNFERFDGLNQLDNPAGRQQTQYYTGGPKPGATDPTPDTYTPGPVSGVTGVVGGQPLPVADCIHRPQGVAQLVNSPSMQFRLGVGQHGPSSLGAEQTVALSEITNAPPVPGDISSIIAGWA